MSNYPPGVTGGAYAIELDMHCSAGHIWTVEAFSELGAAFALDEENADWCPECGLVDTDAGDPTDRFPGSLSELQKLYEKLNGKWVTKTIIERDKALQDSEGDME